MVGLGLVGVVLGYEKRDLFHEVLMNNDQPKTTQLLYTKLNTY